MAPKEVGDLTLSDFEISAVWEFLPDDEMGETMVVPVMELPTNSLESRVVGTRVCLADGRMVWGMLGNLDTQSHLRNVEFVTLSIWSGRWFHLSRYFDADWESRGPRQLASVLGTSIDAVFPIGYDLTAVAIGLPEALIGRVEREPRRRLTDDERLKLLFE